MKQILYQKLDKRVESSLSLYSPIAFIYERQPFFYE